MSAPPVSIDTERVVDAAALAELWAVEDAALDAWAAVHGAPVEEWISADDVTGHDPDEVAERSDSGRVDALVAVERLRGWVDAQAARLLSALAPGPTSSADREWVKDEIAAALRQSPGFVSLRLRVARQLATRLTDTLDLLERGVLSGAHADTLALAVVPLDDATTEKVQQRVLPRAGEQTLTAFRASVRRAVHALDPRSAEERHARARRDRRVTGRAGEDGMGELWACLGLEELAEVMDVLDDTARTTRRRATSALNDARSLDQLRADALVDLVTGRADPDSGADNATKSKRTAVTAPRTGRAGIQVVVAATTLLGLDDEPAEIPGWGPIPASIARTIAYDPTSRWRRLLAEPRTGRLLDYARTTYRPPADLAGYVRARDRRCRFPACDRPGIRCEIDHRHAWEDGGGTDRDNCECLCSRHHHVKHEAGWRVTGNPEDHLSWTSPTGHIYRSSPGRYDPPLTAADDPDPPPF